MDVGEVVSLIDRFADRVRLREHELNSLNVFPVADNDTGSNMAQTLDAIVVDLGALDRDRDLDAVARAVERSALSGRGNSGLILGQFLAGFTSASAGDRLGLANGLTEAATRARAAVAHPVEGTMLTLADAVSTAASGDPDPEHLAGVANDAVRATTGQLQVLADRGVVDAGAAGLALLFDALVDLVSAEPVAEPGLIACNVGVDAPSTASPNIVGHEIRFRVPIAVIDRDELSRMLSALGSDVVIAASADHLGAHLHVLDPHLVANAISAELEGRRGSPAINYDIEPLVARGRP